VRALFGLGAPVTQRKAWERIKALVLEAGLSGFTALDLFTEGLPSTRARPGRGGRDVTKKPAKVPTYVPLHLVQTLPEKLKRR
jgi:hypothetical protein